MLNEPLEKPTLFDFLNFGIGIHFDRKYRKGISYNDTLYEVWDYKSVSIWRGQEWFHVWNTWYDGHRSIGFSFFFYNFFLYAHI